MKTLDAVHELTWLPAGEDARAKADAVVLKFLKEHDGDCRLVAEAWEARNDL